jgi:uncharacterized protein (DUF488 family)
MPSGTIRLYSIGHSNAAVERLITLLRQHSITTLCDVRSAPYSRYNPQFNRESLADSLRAEAIAYRFMGDSLGGKPADGALRTEDGALPDYDKIAASPVFLRGLDQLIAPALIARGVVVWHILPGGNLELGEIEAQQMRMF